MYVCVCECYLLSEHETVSFLLAFYVIIITFNVPLFIFALISAFTLLCTSFFLCFAFLILIRRLRLLGSRPKRCDQRALRLATATEWRISACECAKATHTATHTHICKHTDTVTHTHTSTVPIYCFVMPYKQFARCVLPEHFDTGCQ